MVSQVHRVVASTHHYQKKNNENTPLPVIKSTQKTEGPIIFFVKEAPRIRNLRKNKNWVSFYFIYMLRKTIANKLHFKHNYLPLSVINCFIKWHVWKKSTSVASYRLEKRKKIRPRPRPRPRPPQTSSLWPSLARLLHTLPLPPSTPCSETRQRKAVTPFPPPPPPPLLSSHPTPPHLSQRIQRRKTSQKNLPQRQRPLTPLFQ